MLSEGINSTNQFSTEETPQAESIQYTRDNYRVSNDRKPRPRHSFMLQQFYQIHALNTLREYVLDM